VAVASESNEAAHTLEVCYIVIGADFMGPEGLEPPQYFGPGAHPANEPPPIIRMQNSNQ